MEHLVYVDSEAKELDRLLDGHKTIIIRGFDEKKPPFGEVAEGDTLYLMTTGRKGAVRAKATVKNVLCTDKLSEDESKKLINRYLMELMLIEKQLDCCYGKPFLMLVRVQSVRNIDPFMIKNDIYKKMGDWLVIEYIDKIKYCKWK